MTIAKLTKQNEQLKNRVKVLRSGLRRETKLANDFLSKLIELAEMHSGPTDDYASPIVMKTVFEVLRAANMGRLYKDGGYYIGRPLRPSRAKLAPPTTES